MRTLALGAMPRRAEFELIAERTPREVAIDLTLPLAVTADDETTGEMGEADAVIRLVGLLPPLAPATCKMLLEIAWEDAPLLHAQAKLFLLTSCYSHSK